MYYVLQQGKLGKAMGNCTQLQHHRCISELELAMRQITVPSWEQVSVLRTAPILSLRICPCMLCCLPVGLQDVNDSNEQQETLSFTAHSWNTSHTTDGEENISITHECDVTIRAKSIKR